MHPLLVNFSWYTAMNILGTNDLSISFLEDIGLLPKKTDTLSCHKCGKVMKAQGDKSRKMKFRYVCTNINFCSGTVNPLENTIFKRVGINFNEVLAIIFEFVRETPVTYTVKRISEWRKYRGEKHIDAKTVIDFYKFCRRVCQIIASHMGLEAVGTVKAAETYYRVNRLPKSLSEGEHIHRFLEDMKSLFPGPCQKDFTKNQSSPVERFADPNKDKEVFTIINGDKLHSHENLFKNNTDPLSLSINDKSLLSETVENSLEENRDLVISKDNSYPTETVENSHEENRDLVISKDNSYPTETVMNSPRNIDDHKLSDNKSYPCEIFMNSSENIDDLLLSNDESYFCETLMNSSKTIEDFIIVSDDKSSPKDNDVNCPVKHSCTSVLSEDKSYKRNIINSPVNKKRCITAFNEDEP